MVSAHFHHDPSLRRKPRARLVAALQDTEARNVVLLAGHNNSVLHEPLDCGVPVQKAREDT